MKRKILIIDDEENICQMLKINLEQTNQYEVDTALNAQDGFEKIRNQKYDVISLDVIMPRMEGHEALSLIKKMCQTPVIIMSAYIPPHKKKEIIQAGAFACLEKPVELDRFIHTVEEACR